MTQISGSNQQDSVKADDFVEVNACAKIPLKVFAHLGLGVFVGFIGSPIVERLANLERVITQPSQPSQEAVCPSEADKGVVP